MQGSNDDIVIVENLLVFVQFGGRKRVWYQQLVFQGERIILQIEKKRLRLHHNNCVILTT